MKHKFKKRKPMSMHIFGWFILFVDAAFLLLWVCQILFLQNFYDRMKAGDIIRTADYMVEKYLSGEDYRDEFEQLAIKNEMCIEIRDKYFRSIYWKDVLGKSSSMPAPSAICMTRRAICC